MGVRRTTIELDEQLLAEAQRVLGQPTMRSTVEEALRRVIDKAAREHAERVERQRQYFLHPPEGLDLEVLASEDMWR